MNKRVTYWLDPDEDDGIEVTREDSTVCISVTDSSGESFEVYISPGLFPAVRQAMAAAEGQEERLRQDIR